MSDLKTFGVVILVLLVLLNLLVLFAVSLAMSGG
jgi:hypothetical protein